MKTALLLTSLALTSKFTTWLLILTRLYARFVVNTHVELCTNIPLLAAVCSIVLAWALWIAHDSTATVYTIQFHLYCTCSCMKLKMTCLSAWPGPGGLCVYALYP